MQSSQANALYTGNNYLTVCNYHVILELAVLKGKES